MKIKLKDRAYNFSFGLTEFQMPAEYLGKAVEQKVRKKDAVLRKSDFTGDIDTGVKDMAVEVSRFRASSQGQYRASAQEEYRVSEKDS